MTVFAGGAPGSAPDAAAACSSATTLHATAVALGGCGVLILGGSGSGKSALALQLMAYGAALVADDRVQIRQEGAALIASVPEKLSGLVEARFVGILRAENCGPVPLVLAVDLDRVERDRLPPRRAFTVLGTDLPLLLRAEAPHFAAAILQILKAGRHA